MNRREFLKLSALATIGSSLAACGATPTATPVPPTATKPPVPTNTPVPPAAVAPTATKPAPANTPVPPAATAVPPAPTVAPAATPVRGGALRTVWVSPVTSLDQVKSNLASSDTGAYMCLYNSLFRSTATGTLAPDIVTSYTISPDGLIYTFKIRQGVKFHDGTSLDAQAVKFSIDRLRDAKSGSNFVSLLSAVSDVQAVDAQTVTVTLKNRNVSLLESISGVCVVSPTAVQKLGDDFLRKAVGSGPFKLVSWTPGDKLVLERFDGYWDMGADGKALPYLDRVEITGQTDESVRLLNLRSGEFEFNERNNPKDVDAIKSNPSLVVIETPTGTVRHITFNVTKPPFSNKALRQAVAAAVDREAIIKATSFGAGYTTRFSLPKDHWAFSADPAPKFDKNVAKQKLTEAGYPNGIDVKLSFIKRSPDDAIAEIIKSNLDAVNIRTTLDVLERTAWVDMFTGKQGQFGLQQAGCGLGEPTTAMSNLDPTYAYNFAGYSNGQTTALLAQVQQTMDQAERKKLYTQAIDIMVEEAPYVYFGIVLNTMSASAKLKNVELTRFGASPRFDIAWLGK